MFAAVRHTALQHALHHALGQQSDNARVPSKRTVTNHAAAPMVKIEYRREAEVHTASAQFAAQYISAGAGGVAGIERTGPLLRTVFGSVRRGLQPHLAQRPHGGQMGKPIRLEPLYPATLVVDGDQQIRTQGFDAFAQRSQLRAAFPVA